MSDDERPVAYTALGRGVPVVLKSGQQLGVVDQVLDDPQGGIFLGIVVATGHGSKFVARDLIEQMTTAQVRCALTAEQASALPTAPAKGRGPFRSIKEVRRHP